MSPKRYNQEVVVDIATICYGADNRWLNCRGTSILEFDSVCRGRLMVANRASRLAQAELTSEGDPG